MARLGLSYHEVAKTAYELLEKDTDLTPKKITIEKIRAVLKTGSNSTIAPHLKKWRKEVEDGKTWVKESLDEETAMLSGLYENLKRGASQQAEKVKEECLQSVQAAEQALEDIKNENNRLIRELDEVQEEWGETRAEKNELNLKNLELKSENDRLIDKLVEKSDQIKLLGELNSKLNANLEHFYEKSQEERDALTLGYEQKLADSTQKNEKLITDKDMLQLDLTEAMQNVSKWKTKAEEVDNLVGFITKKNTDLEITVNSHSKEIIDKNSELISQRAQLDGLANDFQDIEKESQDKSGAITELESRLQIIEVSKKELEKKLQQAHSTVESLFNKNLALAEERAEMVRKVEMIGV